MYAYSGIEGRLLDELDGADPNHRRAIFKKFMLLDGLTIGMAQGLECVGGPYCQHEDVSIYGLRVHAPGKNQYRLPFTPFLGSFLFLDVATRKDLDFKVLAKKALERYLEIHNDATKYEQFEPTPPGSLVPYR